MHQHHNRGLRRSMAVALAATGLFAGAAAFAQTPPAGGPGGPGMGPGRGEHMHGGMEHGRGGRLEGRRMDRMLTEVGATAEQKAKIKAIWDAARKDGDAARTAGRADRDQMAALLAAPTIDRAAVERLRAQQLGRHDAASKRMTQAFVDSAEVLTPDQRAKLAAKMKERREKMEKHFGGRGGPDVRGAGPRS